MKRILAGLALATTLGLAACGTEVATTPEKSSGEETKKDLTPTAPEQSDVDAARDAISDLADEYEDKEAADEAAEAEAAKDAGVGDTIKLSAGDLELTTTVEAVTDTISPHQDEYGFGDEAERGMRFAGVTLTIKNTGTEAWDPMYGDTILVMKDDTEAEEAYMYDTPPWDSMPEAKIRPGKSLKINMPFEVPKHGNLGRFQITVTSDSSFDDVTGEWAL